MNMGIFIILLTALSAISTLLTEAIKKAFANKQVNPSANVIALIVSAVVGCGGMIAAYIILGIAFNAVGIIAIIAMIVAIWAGSMVGYDKVIQLVKQIAEGKEQKQIEE